MLVVQYVTDTGIVILFSPTLWQANVFHNNCFVIFKIFASTVIFKFQIKADSKDIQDSTLTLSLVLLSTLQKFVGNFDFFILIVMFL